MKAVRGHLVLVHTRWGEWIGEDALGEGMLEQIKSKGGVFLRQRDVQRPEVSNRRQGEGISLFRGGNGDSESEVTLVQGHTARSCRQLNPL